MGGGAGVCGRLSGEAAPPAPRLRAGPVAAEPLSTHPNASRRHRLLALQLRVGQLGRSEGLLAALGLLC